MPPIPPLCLTNSRAISAPPPTHPHPPDTQFVKPCILDLKMGTQAYPEGSTPEKIAHEEAKYPPQKEIGFRFCGCRVRILRFEPVGVRARWNISVEARPSVPSCSALRTHTYDDLLCRAQCKPCRSVPAESACETDLANHMDVNFLGR